MRLELADVFIRRNGEVRTRMNRKLIGYVWSNGPRQWVATGEVFVWDTQSDALSALLEHHNAKGKELS